jgi:hypothetical protein
MKTAASAFPLELNASEGRLRHRHRGAEQADIAEGMAATVSANLIGVNGESFVERPAGSP